MKIAIAGAGSTRLPLMLGSVAHAARTCRLDQVALFDVRPDRVGALLPVGLALAAECGSLPPVHLAGSPEEALEGAAAVIFTIRPGFEEARARDERACLDLGVLGQETTGPAGLAFAARSVPAVVGLCQVAERVAPGFLPVVFTNPAGMVTQGLHRSGFERAVGICDSATVASRAVAARAGVPFDDVDFQVSGLNHLSWTRRVAAGGRDLLGPALADPTFVAGLVPWHAAETVAQGRIPVEYLYYFHRRQEAVSALRAEPRTRGEWLVGANHAMLEDVGRAAAEGRVSEAILRYAAYLGGRNDSYMEYARGHRAASGAPLSVAGALASLAGQIGGYAEVAMELLAGRTGAAPRLMALNVANAGAIPGLGADDVVEVDCRVDASGVEARPQGDLPAEDLDLVGRVKEYERLGLRGILQGDHGRLVDALVAHPLVDDRELAVKLVGALGL